MTMITGKYRNQDILLVRLNTKLDHDDLTCLEVLRELDLIRRFSTEKNHSVQLLGFTSEGSRDFGLVFKVGVSSGLHKMLKNVKLSVDLKYSLVRDLALSIGEIHKNTILQCHGDLRTNRCVVDERFVLRLLITRLKSMKKLEKQLKHTVHEHDPDLLWTAPELLLRKVNEPTPSSDTYSFAVIVHEIIFQRGPFYVREIQGLKHSKSVLTTSKISMELGSNIASASSQSEDASCAEMIIDKVKKDGLRPSMPFVRKEAKLKFIYDLIVRCWNEDPRKRPSFEKILMDIQEYMEEARIDAAFQTAKRLQSVSKTMVNELLHKNAEAIEERDKAIKYLSHMMPPKLSYELAIGGTHTEPEYNENVTIYFNDLVGFAMVMDKGSANKVIQHLDSLFAAYDRIFKNYDVVPLHRVGSSLLLASGVPDSQPLHASEIAQAALQIRQFVKVCEDNLQLRAGIHSGPVMSGIIGKNIPQYGLFGDTVNTASRMASTGEVGEIQLSESTRNLLDPLKKFVLTGGEEKVIKGKDKMKTWWLKGFVCYSNNDLPVDRRLDKDVVPTQHGSSAETSQEEEILRSRKIYSIAKKKRSTSQRSQKSTKSVKSAKWSELSEEVDLDLDSGNVPHSDKRSVSPLLSFGSKKLSTKSMSKSPTSTKRMKSVSKNLSTKSMSKSPMSPKRMKSVSKKLSKSVSASVKSKN